MEKVDQASNEMDKSNVKSPFEVSPKTSNITWAKKHSLLMIDSQIEK